MDVEREFAAALAHQRKGKQDAARNAYERIVAAQPDHIDSLNNLAVIEWTQRNLHRALDLLGRVIKLAPTNPVYLRSLGQVLN